MMVQLGLGRIVADLVRYALNSSLGPGDPGR